MANKYSTALAQAVAGDQPWDAVLRGGKFILFSGAVPATAETAVDSAYAVMELTLSEGTWVGMTCASMTVTLTSVGAGNTIALTVGGIQIHPAHTCTSSDSTAEADALALSIEDSSFNMGVRASANAGVLTLFAPFGTGTLFNGAVVANAGSGGTVDLSGPFASGADGAYGITWDRDNSNPNILTLPSGAVWSGTCPAEVVSPVAITYFRYVLDPTDDGLSDDTVDKVLRRWQGSVGGVNNSSADLRFPLVSATVADGVKLTVNSYTFTIPLS